MKIKTIHVDSLKDNTVQYTVTNCGSSSLQIDENELLDYESTYSNIYFKLFECGTTKGCIPYYFAPHDMQRAIEGKDRMLKPGASFTYDFDFFKVYSIEKAGKYKLVGFFKRNLFGSKTGCRGYYLQESNAIDIKVVD